MTSHREATELLTGVTQLLGLPDAPEAQVQLSGPTDVLASRYAVTPVLQASVAVVGEAFADLALAEGRPRPDVSVDSRAAAVAGSSHRYLRIDGHRPAGDQALAFVRAADGFVRLHALYPWHLAALLRVLNIAPGDDALVPAVTEAVAGWQALELEEALAAAGAVGFAVRSADSWAKHPQGRAVAALPLLSLSAGDGRGADRRAGPRLRVLDLTRVIAGPVAGRTLGALGADVLRIDDPALPEMVPFADTGLARRSALLDLRRHGDRATFDALLATADVLLQGYRPGALAVYGLSDADLAEAYPGLVTVTLCAWGEAGPWAGRRGFDSLVQAACGIALVEGSADAPGVLPTQVLDYATGFLAAACALRGVAGQRRDGAGRRARVSLAQTAHWLTTAGVRERPVEPWDVAPYLTVHHGGYGRTRVAQPPLVIDGQPPHWPSPAVPFGSSEATWLA